MGSAVVDGRIGVLSESLSDGGRAEIRIYAPSLADLPRGSPLVMATLPVIDWNDCLLQAMRVSNRSAQEAAYAAMVMVDPFACWEDFVDLLQQAGIRGVINFPPASIIEQATTSGVIDAGQEIELRRLEWFGSQGFRIIFATSNSQAIGAAQTRLKTCLDAILLVPPTALKLPIGNGIELAATQVVSPSPEHSGSLPILELQGRAFDAQRIWRRGLSPGSEVS